MGSHHHTGSLFCITAGTAFLICVAAGMLMERMMPNWSEHPEMSRAQGCPIQRQNQCASAWSPGRSTAQWNHSQIPRVLWHLQFCKWGLLTLIFTQQKYQPIYRYPVWRKPGFLFIFFIRINYNFFPADTWGSLETSLYKVLILEKSNLFVCFMIMGLILPLLRLRIILSLILWKGIWLKWESANLSCTITIPAPV